MCLASARVAYVCCNHWDLARWYWASTTRSSTIATSQCQGRLMLSVSASGVFEEASDPRTTPAEQRCPPPQLRQSSFFPGGKGDADTTRGRPLGSGSPGGGGRRILKILHVRLETSIAPALAYTPSTEYRIVFLHSVFCSWLLHPLRRSFGVAPMLEPITAFRVKQESNRELLQRTGLRKVWKRLAVRHSASTGCWAFAHTGNELESTPGIRAV